MSEWSLIKSYIWLMSFGIDWVAGTLFKLKRQQLICFNVGTHLVQMNEIVWYLHDHFNDFRKGGKNISSGCDVCEDDFKGYVAYQNYCLGKFVRKFKTRPPISSPTQPLRWTHAPRMKVWHNNFPHGLLHWRQTSFNLWFFN